MIRDLPVSNWQRRPPEIPAAFGYSPIKEEGVSRGMSVAHAMAKVYFVELLNAANPPGTVAAVLVEFVLVDRADCVHNLKGVFYLPVNPRDCTSRARCQRRAQVI